MNTINCCPAITNPTLTRIEENIMIKIEEKIPEPYPYTHPIREIPDYGRIVPKKKQDA